MISVIQPSRGRPDKAYANWQSWFINKFYEIDWILSLDEDDTAPYNSYFDTTPIRIIRNKNRSAVDAINNAAKLAKFDILMVVSDDTNVGYANWDNMIAEVVKGKTDWILKTQDGIQPWIITMPVMDRAYFNRTGNIYDPDFKHMFCDTWLTVQADISGRKITSSLVFKHYNELFKDDVRKRSDATWQQGEQTFIQKIRQLTIGDLKKIEDVSMRNWIRNKTGIRA